MLWLSTKQSSQENTKHNVTFQKSICLCSAFTKVIDFHIICECHIMCSTHLQKNATNQKHYDNIEHQA